MSNWDDNSWQLYADNINQVLIKDGAGNVFDLESFADPDDESTLWRLVYVAHNRPMLDFWYGIVFREAGSVAPELVLPGGPLANYSNATAKAWMDVGDMAEALVDADDGSLERLESFVNLKGITHKLALYRVGGVLPNGGLFLYARLRKIYAPPTIVVPAPDGGGIGRGK